MLLRDYAITPDVFDVTSYPSEEIAAFRLAEIRQVMMTEGLVRDLRDGEWRTLFRNDNRPWDRHAKELVRKLAGQGRLMEVPPTRPAAPTNDGEWCAEALASHKLRALTGGVIVTEAVKAAYSRETLVERIDRLSRAPWWDGDNPSVRLGRHLTEYKQHLGPILRCANSLQFIDPYLDPAKPGYRDFAAILKQAGRRTPPPAVEIHRVCWEESRDKRADPDVLARMENAFRGKLSAVALAAGLHVEVFLWDDFHDRYLISNLIGISLPYGFETTSNPNAITTWTRLGRNDRDDIQREFEEASGRHALQRRFRLPE